MVLNCIKRHLELTQTNAQIAFQPIRLLAWQVNLSGGILFHFHQQASNAPAVKSFYFSIPLY